MASPERRRRRLRRGSGRATGTSTSTDSGTGADAGNNPTGWADGGGPAGGGPEQADYPEPDGSVAATPSVHDPAPAPAPEPPTRRRGADQFAEERDSERGLRGLIGSGASQVSVGAAMRARDATRPTDADLSEAEERLVIIRRNWVPREDLPRSGR